MECTKIAAALFTIPQSKPRREEDVKTLLIFG